MAPEAGSTLYLRMELDMSGNNWKVTLRVGKDGLHRGLVETRMPDGSVLRTPFVWSTEEDKQERLQAHQDAVAKYDPAEHARAHELARTAAKSQASK